MKEIPLLTKEDIECRIQSVNDKGAVLLLYKTARADMRILDEGFGAMNWQRYHEVVNGNLFCTISIYDPDKGQWVSKQDCGVPSNTQGEKGEASDAFKRAGFSWGIGRELYDSPFIWISGNVDKYDRFHVTEIQYDREKREFTRLTICDDKGKERYRLGTKTDRPQSKDSTDDRRQKGIAAIVELVKKNNTAESFADFLKQTTKKDDLNALTIDELQSVYKGFKKWLESGK
nr:MAG TPA: Rad52/22 family double-strand break repair protein [Caudoviricetes sp.]